MGKIKALGKSGQQPKQNKPLSACDQMLKICNTIWTSRHPEQIKGCKKMLKTYIKANGNENIGVTFIQLELSRQIRLNALFAKMGQVQEQLKVDNAAKAAKANKQTFEQTINNGRIKSGKHKTG